MKAKNKYMKGIIETNITEILRIIGDQEEDLTDLRINLGKTSDNVDNLNLLTQEQVQAIQLNSGEILSNYQKHTEDIDNVNLKLVYIFQI